MYAELFQKSDRPFRATPDARFYYPYDSVEQARQTVLRVVRRGEGPVAVMGGVGLGKSLLAQVLADDLSDRFDVVCLHAARLCSRRAMLQAILFELHLPYRELSEGELRLSLMERMEPSPELAPEGLAVIVDEAQTLPTKLLEELRLITNFMRHGAARARLVLLGGMQLEETFALPEMSSFNQRLAARCFLQPMNRQQTTDFVRHQFNRVQVDAGQLITRDALENVYVASEGIPRLVNQVMDHAMMLAITQDQYPISAALVQEAWADLQQLPVHWGSEPAKPVSAVEFGSIDDLDQDFELEPEGAEELEHKRAPTMSWPAMADLEDFGPASQHAISDVKVAVRMPGAETRKPSFGDHSSDLDLFVFTEEVEDTNVLPFEGNLYTSWGPQTDSTMHVFELDRHALQNGMPLVYPVETIPMPLTVASQASAGDPFGQDFDEEFPVDASHVQRWQANQQAQAQANSRSSTSARSVPELSPPAAIGSPRSSIEPTEQDTSHLTRNFECSTMEWSSMSVAASGSSAQWVQPGAHSMISGHPIEVGQNAAAALQQDIEDLIGQLNFSAFSVELDTVEQISPEVSRRAAGAAPGGKTGALRPESKDSRLPLDYDKPHTLAMSPYDDDRDMLIIEEEIPSSMRHSQNVPVMPNVGTMAYPQLFQQLRG